MNDRTILFLVIISDKTVFALGCSPEIDQIKSGVGEEKERETDSERISRRQDGRTMRIPRVFILPSKPPMSKYTVSS